MGFSRLMYSTAAQLTNEMIKAGKRSHGEKCPNIPSNVITAVPLRKYKDNKRGTANATTTVNGRLNWSESRLAMRKAASHNKNAPLMQAPTIPKKARKTAKRKKAWVIVPRIIAATQTPKQMAATFALASVRGIEKKSGRGGNLIHPRELF